MKRYFLIAFAFLVTIVFASTANAQSRMELPLTGWKYQNGQTSSSTVGDTLSNTTADTVTIGLLGHGGLAPVAVTVSFECYQASGAADTVKMTYAIGNGGFYATVGSAQNEITSATSTTKVYATRTFVLNTTGAAAAHNTQSTVSPHGDALRIILAQPTGTTATVPFRIKAFGIYEKQ